MQFTSGIRGEKKGVFWGAAIRRHLEYPLLTSGVEVAFSAARLLCQELEADMDRSEGSTSLLDHPVKRFWAFKANQGPETPLGALTLDAGLVL